MLLLPKYLATVQCISRQPCANEKIIDRFAEDEDFSKFETSSRTCFGSASGESFQIIFAETARIETEPSQRGFLRWRKISQRQEKSLLLRVWSVWLKCQTKNKSTAWPERVSISKRRAYLLHGDSNKIYRNCKWITNKCYNDQSKLILNTTNLTLATGRAQEFFFKAREREAPSETRSEQIFKRQTTYHIDFC